MLPRHLYKYRSLSGESFRYTQAILTRNVVYLASVAAFNDPFEGHFKLVMPPDAPIAQRQYETWANQLANNRVRGEAAVLSLTERRGDVLMWSHYADHHRGICIEFDTTIPGSIFSQAERVRYLTEFKEVTHGTVLDDDEFTRLVCTAKAEHWRYEQEWRVVQRRAGTRSFPPECITGVILGCLTPPSDVEWIVEWIRRRETPTKLYQAKQKLDAFALEINEIDINDVTQLA